jgi:hypothetical protein
MFCWVFGSLGVTLRLARYSDDFTEGNVGSLGVTLRLAQYSDRQFIHNYWPNSKCLWQTYNTLATTTIFMDFETAAQNAARTVFPGITVKGCFFHRFCEVTNVMMRLLSPSSNSRNSSPVVVGIHCPSSMMFCWVVGSLDVTLRLGRHSNDFTEGNVGSC